MTTVTAIGRMFTSVQKTIQTSSGSAINIVICLVTVGSEQLFSFAAFRCPCAVNATLSRGAVHQNFFYGWVFIIVPAFALFVLGCGMNVKTWKLCTGCIKRSESASRGCIAGCSTLLEIFVQALVAPMTWMSVAFLDGKYYACAVSVKPYLETCAAVNVKSTNLLKMSMEFNSNKQHSQIVGWILVAVTLLAGFLFYTIYRCCSPLTYHHRKYAKWYRAMESKAFEKKAKEQIQQEVENETVARFLQSKRDKSHWDKISTVFNFTRDKNQFALYSRLDEWNEKHKHKDEYRLPSEIEKAVEVTEDDSSLDASKNNNNNSSNSNISRNNANSDTAPNTSSAIQPSDHRFPNSPRPKSPTGAQVIPKLPPPPPGKRRSSVISQDNVAPKRPNGTPQSPTSPSEKKMLQPFPMTSPNSDNDATEKSELIRLSEVSLQKSKSMGDIKREVKSTTESASAPSYEDED